MDTLCSVVCIHCVLTWLEHVIVIHIVLGSQTIFNIQNESIHHLRVQSQIELSLSLILSYNHNDDREGLKLLEVDITVEDDVYLKMFL